MMKGGGCPHIMVDGKSIDLAVIGHKAKNPFSGFLASLDSSRPSMTLLQALKPVLGKKSDKELLETLLHLVAHYDVEMDYRSRLQALLKIQILDQRMQISSLFPTSSLSDVYERELSLPEFRKRSLDSTHDNWHFLLAYRGYESIAEMDEVIAKGWIKYELYHDAVPKRCHKLNKRHKEHITKQLNNLKNSLAQLVEPKEVVLRIQQEQLNTECANLLLEFCLETLRSASSKYFDRLWEVVAIVSEWAAYAEAIRKVPNSPFASRSRSTTFFSKDVDDLRSDSPVIEAQLRASKELQEQLSIHNDIYTLERVFRLRNEIENRSEWIGALMNVVAHLIEKYCVKEHVTDPYFAAMLRYLFQIREIIFAMPVNDDEKAILQAFGYREENVPARRESIGGKQSDEAYIYYMQSRLQQIISYMHQDTCVHSQRIELSPTTKMDLRLLGGVDVVVYWVNARGMPMVLRCYKWERSDLNEAALAVIRRLHPKLLDTVYHRGGRIGDHYESCEFSEYLGGGSLTDYIRAIHKSRKGSFTVQQKKRIFSIFKELIFLLHDLHENRCYFPDIKPDNVLFDKDPFIHDAAQLKISDKKSPAILPRDSDLNNNAMYTPDFAAPEMLAMHEFGGKPIDPRAHDFFALAITILQVITGETEPLKLRMGHTPRDDFERTLLLGVTGKIEIDEPRNDFEETILSYVRSRPSEEAQKFKGMLSEDPGRRLDYVTCCLSKACLMKLEQKLFTSKSVIVGQATTFRPQVLKPPRARLHAASDEGDGLVASTNGFSS